jgi:hypothetical protein
VFPDLLGFGAVAPEHVVDWALQIDVAGHPLAQPAKKIDGRLPRSLIALLIEISDERPESDYASLANRDLQRGQSVGLASGEAVARRLGFEPLSEEQLGLTRFGWRDETPLWLYILKEGEVLYTESASARLGGGLNVGSVAGASSSAAICSRRS